MQNSGEKMMMVMDHLELSTRCSSSQVHHQAWPSSSSSFRPIFFTRCCNSHDLKQSVDGGFKQGFSFAAAAASSSSCLKRGESIALQSKGSGDSMPPAYNDELRTRTSADEVRKEILECYALVQKLGKGVVYFGSSRTKTDHPHYLQAMELGREVALLLNCTSWTGVGPGMMDAVTQGALQAHKPVGGFKISNEGGTWTNSCVHPYLSDHTYLTCQFFSARKHGLADAGVRDNQADHTAYVSLPGGVGTLDEMFEILTLIQLKRLGSAFPVPFLVLNYDGFFTGLIQFLKSCQEWGMLSAGELDSLWKVCNTNLEALEYLADFYCISDSDRLYRNTLNDMNRLQSFHV